jgi:hypothetical protein
MDKAWIQRVECEGDSESVLILHSIVEWFNTHNQLCHCMFSYLRSHAARYLDASMPTLSIVSLRSIEECINRVLRNSRNPSHIATYSSYKRAIATHTKTFFDMYCRHHTVQLLFLVERNGKSQTYTLKSSIAQLNLMRWILTRGRDCVLLAATLSRKKRPTMRRAAHSQVRRVYVEQ